jgi:hypothetical protein
MEQDNLYQQCYGQAQVWNNPNPPYYNLIPPNGSAYVGGLVYQGTVKILIGSADPTNYGYTSISYLANQAVVDGRHKIQTISDGSSNTVLYAEGYSYAFSSSNSNGNYSYVSREGQWTVMPETLYNYSGNGYSSTSLGPVFGPVVGKTFQVRPSPYGTTDSKGNTTGGPDPYTPQSLASGALLVGMGDGSVRGVSGGISAATWYAALTPDAGDILGSDW